MSNNDFNQHDKASKMKTSETLKTNQKMINEIVESSSYNKNQVSRLARAGENIAVTSTEKIGHSIKELALDMVDGEDISLKKTIKSTNNNIRTTKDAVRILLDAPNQSLRAFNIGKKGINSSMNVGRYVKGAETVKYSSSGFYTYKHHRKYNSEKYGLILTAKKSHVNNRIKTLSNQNAMGVLNNADTNELKLLKSKKADKYLEEKFKRKSNAYRGAKGRVAGAARKKVEATESTGTQELMASYDFANNKYVKKFSKASAKAGAKGAQVTALKTGKAVVHVAKKTGIDKPIISGASKIAHSRQVSGIKSQFHRGKDFVHGGAYKKASFTVNKYTPDKIKTAHKKAAKGLKTGTAKINFAKGKISGSKLGALYRITKKAAKGIISFKDMLFVAMQAAMMFVKKYIFIGVAALLAMVLILNLLMSAITSLLFLFATDKDNLQLYVDHIYNTITEYEKEMETEILKAKEENDSLNDERISYSNLPTIDNTKEILSMAAVYSDQQWPDWGDSEGTKIRTYMDKLFEDSHSYEISLTPTYSCEGCQTERVEKCTTVNLPDGTSTESCYSETVKFCEGHRDVMVTITSLGFDEIFELDTGTLRAEVEESGTSQLNHQIVSYDSEGEIWAGWDERNIEWAKIFFEQDWYEYYGVIVGTSGQYIELTQEQIEAYVSLLPEDLDPNRRKVVEAAISGVGRIPYYWNWRDLISLKPGIESNNFGTRVRPDDFGVRTALGLDCSGFVMWSFYTAGYHPADDAKWGGLNWGYTTSIYNSPETKIISRSQLEPGDLGMIQIVGGTSNHVGIFLGQDESGNDLWIHSSSGQGGASVTTFPRFKIFLGVELFD